MMSKKEISCFSWRFPAGGGPPHVPPAVKAGLCGRGAPQRDSQAYKEAAQSGSDQKRALAAGGRVSAFNQDECASHEAAGAGAAV